ncbi:hypothetical protein KPH14_012591, partial [Odynerus spinipes]
MESEKTAKTVPTMEEIVRQVMAQIGKSATPVPSTSNVVGSNVILDAVREFSGEKLGDDASVWCIEVEEITREATPQVRLSVATHVLVGPAKTWYA